MTISNSETQNSRQILIKVYFKMFPLLRAGDGDVKKKKKVFRVFLRASERLVLDGMHLVSRAQ